MVEVAAELPSAQLRERFMLLLFVAVGIFFFTATATFRERNVGTYLLLYHLLLFTRPNVKKNKKREDGFLNSNRRPARRRDEGVDST
mmetsp:Transcript_17322/g.43081  ORF Transcript_17322/g.43081 Transcript_17322/m.43081 type:complete len:87 (-) Transcript_17322:66-326(-)